MARIATGSYWEIIVILAMKIAASQKAKYASENKEKEHASGLSTGSSSVIIPQKTTDTARSLSISIIGTGDKRQMIMRNFCQSQSILVIYNVI